MTGQGGILVAIGRRAGATPRLRAGLSPLARGALLLAPPLLLIFASFFFAQTDPDYWWHARTGQYIRDTGQIPRTDPFSGTAAGKPWIAQEWLTELALALTGARFGYGGNVALVGLLTVVGASCVYAACRQRGLNPVGAMLLMSWGFVMALPLMNVRPQMVTTLLLAVYALVLTRYRQGARRSLWLLPPLMALWANLHAGYAIGLFLVGLTLVGETIALLRRERAAPLAPLLLAAALSGAAALLNPRGIGLFGYALSAMTKGNLAIRQVAEWQSPDFHQPFSLVFAASLLLLLALGVARPPLGPTDVLWAVSFALLGLQSIRHIPLYAIVVMPLLGARLQAANMVPRRPVTRRLIPIALWAIAATFALVVATARPGTLPLQLGAAPNAAGYPAGAIGYLRAHDVEGNIFNEYRWGGYLIAQLYPRQRVFIDGRAEIYGDDLLVRYQDVMHLRPGWRQTLDDYDIRLVLIDRESPLATALRDDPGWQELYAGDVERLFARRGAAGRATP